MVTEVGQFSVQREKESFEGITEQSTNAIDEIFNISGCIRNVVDHMNPSLIYDLKKYHPEAWKVFERFKYEFLKGTVAKNIKRGKEEGFYRKDANEELLSTLRVETIQLAFNGAFGKVGLPFNLVQTQLFEHFIHGVLNATGLEEYSKYQSGLMNETEKDNPKT